MFCVLFRTATVTTPGSPDLEFLEKVPSESVVASSQSHDHDLLMSVKGMVVILRGMGSLP